MTRVFLFTVVLLGGAGSAHALDVGQSCKLKASLPASVTTGRGSAESVLDVGAEVTALFVGAEGRSRVKSGSLTAVVATSDLDAACAGTLRLCRASSLFLLYESNRSDSIASSIPVGTPVSVLRAGKVWAHLRAGAVQGYATVEDLKAHCATEDGAGLGSADAEGPGTEIVERGEGPGVLYLPFVLEGGAPAGVADSLAEGLFERLSYYRPDIGRLPLALERTGAWKAHLASAAARAKAAGLAYALVGRLGPEEGQPASAGLVVSVALVDAASGKTLKGVRARPATGDAEHAWTEPVLLALVPLMSAAPGSRLPVAKSVAPVAPSPTTTTTTQEAPRTTGESWGTPWFANPWGWTTLALAVGAGVGAGFVGNNATVDNASANATPAIDPARASLRERAWQQAVAADALTGTAVVTGVAAVIIFAAGIGVDD
jgi:hypothetical protein